MRFPPIVPLLGLIAVSIAGAEGLNFQIRGQGWADAGRIMHVTDTLELNLNGNWQQSAGAQFTAIAAIGESWEGALGFGGSQLFHSLGSAEQARTARASFQNFITESRMTYYRGDRRDPGFSLTFGNFSYIYNPDVKNLGLYLLRGPVYPGFLESGFRHVRADSTKGGVLGMKVHHVFGNFRHDLILSNEREVPPTFDWHLAYVAKFKTGPLEIGGGVNFYRLFPSNVDFTIPRPNGQIPNLHGPDSALSTDGLPHHPYESQYIEVDSATGKVVQYTHKGTKLMALFTLDFKKLFDIRSMGPNDLKLYGEGAILGIKNYGKVYDNIKERIPVMFGFNFPTFGWLDYLSLEVEWYGAKYRNDMRKLGNFNSLGPNAIPFTVNPTTSVPSPIPVSYKDYVNINLWTGGLDSAGRLVNDTTVTVKGTALDIQNLTQDNWKWSLNVEKTVGGHIMFAAQVANDHFRPRPVGGPINELGGWTEAFSSTKDWYMMFRMGYFF